MPSCVPGQLHPLLPCRPLAQHQTAAPLVPSSVEYLSHVGQRSPLTNPTVAHRKLSESGPLLRPPSQLARFGDAPPGCPETSIPLKFAIPFQLAPRESIP